MIDIGKSLKFHRESRHLSQSELARQSGISQQSLSRWENNENVINAFDCVRLASFYGISIDYLIGFENEDGSKNLVQ